MPKIIIRASEIDVTPEKYLEACSNEELMEIDLLIQSPRFRERLTAEKRQTKLPFDALPTKNARS